MAKFIKTIGVLTSGGDAPGMNAAVRAVVRTAAQNNIRVMGVRRGYLGLIHGDMYEMNLRTVSNTLGLGGTLLYSARCPEFKTPEGLAMAKNVCLKAGVEGLITIGGDGTFRGARDLSLAGIPCVGVPGTIDNDIACSDYTIGFDTAVNTAVQMIDRVRDTSQSHDRCSVVEVMGRHAGHLALHAGVAGGATCVLVPEIPFDLERDVLAKMRTSHYRGRQTFIIVVAEGVGGSQELVRQIEEHTGIVTRLATLGHVQRGGSPSARDRIVASQMGHYAVELLRDGTGNRVVAYKDDKILDYDIEEAVSMTKGIDMELYRIANEISI